MFKLSFGGPSARDGEDVGSVLAVDETAYALVERRNRPAVANGKGHKVRISNLLVAEHSCWGHEVVDNGSNVVDPKVVFG